MFRGQTGVMKSIIQRSVNISTSFKPPMASLSTSTTPTEISTSFKPPMATLSTSTTPTVGLVETFTRLKQQGKVAFIPYITAGDPDLSPTLEAKKVLDSCGSDIIELGVPYSDPLADGPVIQAAASRSLSRGTNFAKVLSMLKDVIPQLSCPVALFTDYNPILKPRTEKFMATKRDTGLHDVPLEETEMLRKEAARHNIELQADLQKETMSAFVQPGRAQEASTSATNRHTCAILRVFSVDDFEMTYPRGDDPDGMLYVQPDSGMSLEDYRALQHLVANFPYLVKLLPGRAIHRREPAPTVTITFMPTALSMIIGAGMVLLTGSIIYSSYRIEPVIKTFLDTTGAAIQKWNDNGAKVNFSFLA